MHHIWFCEYCSSAEGNESRKYFPTQKDFVNHIRTYHLVRKFRNDLETFICRYGPNNLCLLSNSLDGVENNYSSHDSPLFTSQRDYERHLVGFHLLKHPVYKHPDIKSPLSIPPSHCNEKPSRKWSVYQSVVNLPAILNDPNYREKDIFAKLWGDKFENAEVLPSPHLPVITEKHFIEYFNKIGVRKLDNSLDKSSPKCQINSPSNSFSDNSPLVKSSKKVLNNELSLDTSTTSIPTLYFDQNFNLKDEKTFCQVIPLHPRQSHFRNVSNPFEKMTSSSDKTDSVNNSSRSNYPNEKYLQKEAFRTQHDQLVNYLDIIELNIAEQV
ncbi:unnamed protein product, partial [Schistosoma turkestanicum]